MKTGYAELPLHYGRAPRWLFEKMTRLSRAVIEAIVIEHNTDEFLRRLADPFWFQAFGSILGFDWHSSGLTTTVCGAMKQGLKDLSNQLGIYICGGKGRTSRKTPEEIQRYADHTSLAGDDLVYASRLSARVDNSCIQDGYNLYHHIFIFTRKGNWAVIQQGMNPEHHQARRYHWLSLNLKSYVDEPHTAVCCDTKTAPLNLIAHESASCRKAITEITRQHPEKIIKEAKTILKMPAHHPVLKTDINEKYLYKILIRTYDRTPADFENLLTVPGIGPKTLRALALIAELLYNAAPSFRDPARFSFAHGGKDGFPYPVNQETYNKSIAFLESAIKKARIGQNEKFKALKKLAYI